MRVLAAIWGVGGVLCLLGWAMVRLGARAVEALDPVFSKEWWHWGALAGWVVFMAYSEGYRAFQRAFSPRVVARAQYLAHRATPIQAVLAPFFCMGFFHATRKRIITTWTLFFCMISLVLLVSLVPQPWRGLIDVGVVVGLAWGCVAIMVYAWRSWCGAPLDCDPDLPATEKPHTRGDLQRSL